MAIGKSVHEQSVREQSPRWAAAVILGTAVVLFAGAGILAVAAIGGPAQGHYGALIVLVLAAVCVMFGLRAVRSWKRLTSA
jgi:hypothetical protein